MEHREDGTGLAWVDELVSVPGGCGGPRFRFAVTDDTGDDEVGVVHDRTKGYAEGIAEFATFVDAPGCLCIDVTGKSVRLLVRGTGGMACLGKPPGTLNFLTRLDKPARSRVYEG